MCEISSKAIILLKDSNSRFEFDLLIVIKNINHLSFSRIQ